MHTVYVVAALANGAVLFFTYAYSVKMGTEWVKVFSTFTDMCAHICVCCCTWHDVDCIEMRDGCLDKHVYELDEAVKVSVSVVCGNFFVTSVLMQATLGWLTHEHTFLMRC